MQKLLQRTLHTIGLQTPGGRLCFFAIITIGIFSVPYDWLSELSLWQRLGIPSPSIGLTRAYWLLLHLDPVGAWHRNPLIYLVITIGLPLLAYDVLTLIKKRIPLSASKSH